MNQHSPLEVPSDETTLIHAARAGDRMAFATLYTRYNAPVLARISHLVGPGAAVDDLLQETFLRAYNALPAFRSECPFRWWLLRIAMHTVRSAQRSWKRSIFRLFVGDREEAALSQSGRAAAEQYPDLVLVHAGLARLSPPLREAVVLFEFEGRTLEEIAAELGVSMNTISSRVRRGRIALRAHVERLSEGCGFERGLEACRGGTR